MNSKKRILAVLLAFVMIFSIAGTSMAADMPAASETSAADAPQGTKKPEDTASPESSGSPEAQVSPTPPATQSVQPEASASASPSANVAVIAVEDDAGTSTLSLATEGEDTLIASADDLLTVMNDASYWDKNLKVSVPIDMNGLAAQPIGNSSTPFSGTFDGNGQTISNLEIAFDLNYAGLFGYNSGTLKNITLANSSISGDQYVGGMIGYNAGTVQGCAVKNTTVSSASTQTMGYVGGFAGYSKGNVSQCFVAKGSASQSVAGKGKGVGGFVGYCYAPGKISECYTTTEVTSQSEQVGGFVGFGYSGTMENCFSAGSVTGAKYVGGFVGSEDSAKYTACYTLTPVVSTGANNAFGKFFGDGFFMSSYVSKSFYLSTVSISGNGTEKGQGAYFLAKTEDELKALAATLGSVWTADADHNNGYPYLINVQAPANSGGSSEPTELAQPSGLTWTEALASWNTVPGAHSYTVVLYKNTDTLVGTYTNITDTSKDFKTIITETGEYSFTVQAMSGSDSYVDGQASTRSTAYQFVKKDDQGFILISTPDELLALSDTSADLTKNYKLANDIDMTAQVGKVIGKYNNGMAGEKAFTGIFDGNGHTVKNLSIAGEALFGYVGTDSVIRKLTLENATIEDAISSSMHYPAALVSNNKGTIEKCFSNGSTVVSKYNNRVGGLVGNNEGTVMQSGVSGGSVTYQSTGTMAGGLIGRNTGTVSESFASASVSGYKWAGGFVGGVEDGTITDCYTTGSVTGNNELGGFAGMLSDPAVLTNVYAAVDVNASAGTGGVLVGGKGFSFATVGSIVNGYYNSGKLKPGTEVVTVAATGKTTSEMKGTAFASALGNAWKVDAGTGDKIVNNGYPYLANAAPAADAPVAESISVQILVAAWDATKYQFVKSEEPFTVKAEGENITAEQVMRAAQTAGQMTYTAEQSSTGTFIKTINGKTLEAPDGWMFTINDKQSPVGVSAAQIKAGDKILWYEGTPANGYKAPTWADMTAPVPVQYENIGTTDQLVALMNSANPAADWAKNYKLTANIDLAGVTASPIGSETVPFSGVFEGDGYRIKNLKIEKSVGSQNIGLFGVIEGASILNLTVENACVQGGSRIGVLVGVARVNIANGTANLIGNCHVSGTLNATGISVIKQTDAGGLVGINDGGSKDGKSAFSAIDGCSSGVEVTASTGGADNTESGHVGGFVGWNKGNISQCEATGNVFGGNSTGGFVGSNFGYANIYKSHATGNIVGGYTTGGFAGSIGMGTSAERCYATGNVVAIEDGYGYYFGGFVGSASGTLKECVSTGTLTPGWSYNGGFAGTFDGTVWSYHDKLLTLKDCYGNSETSLGTKVKGLGNYIGGTHEATDAAAAKTALTKE
ncbi:MAG: GLUG motif-containing protein [Christensenella sp.]|uniref:GLUG motif-containing protein n=1 Tax=Christensenella sp. TaxID=1935934 RepID=UPI002B20871E|nr:GLUG motif-containing protein [Christensenella sp.]MEA5004414.1 GLUG motif-containing protein [Christensenella sp.]